MKKLLIVYDVRGWAYERRANALKRYAPDDWRVQIVPIRELRDEMVAESNVVFNLEYAGAGDVSQRIKACGLNRPAYAVSYNSDSRRRAEFWEKVTATGAFVVCNNKEVFDFHKRPARTCCISNGVDVAIFRPTVPMSRRQWRVIWCGSTSAKKGKGYKDILQPIVAKLAKRDVIADFRPIDNIDERVLQTDPLVDWYNSASAVVCASSTEGTPNFVTEAAACGCAVVTTKVGNALEWGRHGKNLLFCERTQDAVAEAIVAAIERREELGAAARDTMQGWAYGEPGRRAAYYFALFNRLVSGMVPQPFSYDETTPEKI